MIIESIIGIAVVSVIVYLFWQVIMKEAFIANTDLNNDGKTNVKDAKAALDQVVVKAVEKVDVNKDGKMSVADAKVVGEKVKEIFKKSETVQATPEVVAETKPPKRARKKGKLVADNPATPEVNEAWEGGKAPEKNAKPKKPRKPKMTVAK